MDRVSWNMTSCTCRICCGRFGVPHCLHLHWYILSVQQGDLWAVEIVMDLSDVVDLCWFKLRHWRATCPAVLGVSWRQVESDVTRLGTLRLTWPRGMKPRSGRMNYGTSWWLSVSSNPSEHVTKLWPNSASQHSAANVRILIFPSFKSDLRS